MKHQIPESWFVFGIVSLIYLFCAAGHIDTIDADASVELAKAMVNKFSFVLSPERPDPMIYVMGANGDTYSKMGLSPALLYVPVVLIEKGLRIFVPELSTLALPFLISLVNPLISAFMITLIYLYFRNLSKSSTEASLICILIAFGTYLFPYSKTCQREILQAFCLVSAFILPKVLEKRFPNLAYWVAGTAFGFGIMTKLTFLLFLPPVLLGIYYFSPTKKQCLYFVTPILLLGLIQGLYSYRCFGSFIGTGYSKDVIQINGRAWSTPFLHGIWQQTLDWKTGFVFYNPLLILISPLLIYKIKNKLWTKLDSAVLLVLSVQLAIHARWWSPTGDNALGPRYLVVILPCLALWLDFPFASLLGRLNLYAKGCLASLFVLGVLFQLAQTSIKPQLYWTLNSKSSQKLEVPLWLANFVILKNKFQSSNEDYNLKDFGGSDQRVDLSKHRSYQGFNFWWSHLHRYSEQTNSAGGQKHFAHWYLNE